ncbi:GNAT family N-acetyltransferase [Spongiactinospora sp. TRM90649]|uniref:GNAT family N-acetyltransferase n=1 Tax=Spongiactinospora sp. TRM90649 TaxID=3031114 RepID=UPI0023F93891|nr:GNAT family N-acetyltransferase [Spongiactinospora sp. TRM90649]MDF5757801.1 GNAT family N-acetyltransferase [Spongiactinospora sp. TRM90649]
MTSERDQRILLDELETYYDAVPRGGARAEVFGPLTLFVREGNGWPYYARPSLGWNGAPGAPVTAAEVERVRARQRELGVPESFEWVAETTPWLRGPVEETGLVTHEHPLMVLDPALAPRPDVRARIIGPGEREALAGALAVPYIAFAEPGTAVGTAGAAELAATVREQRGDGTVDRMAERIRTGLSTVAVVVEDGQTVSSGQHQPVGGVTEIVGVGTLPDARRRGLGRAVTAALVADATARGIGTIFLSAGDDDVARLYATLGFRRVGTAVIAEPSPWRTV